MCVCVANTGSCVGLQTKIGHPAHRYRQLMKVPVLSVIGIKVSCDTCIIVVLGLRSEIVDLVLYVVGEKETCGIMTCGIK